MILQRNSLLLEAIPSEPWRVSSGGDRDIRALERKHHADPEDKDARERLAVAHERGGNHDAGFRVRHGKNLERFVMLAKASQVSRDGADTYAQQPDVARDHDRLARRFRRVADDQFGNLFGAVHTHRFPGKEPHPGPGQGYANWEKRGDDIRHSIARNIERKHFPEGPEGDRAHRRVIAQVFEHKHDRTQADAGRETYKQESNARHDRHGKSELHQAFASHGYMKGNELKSAELPPDRHWRTREGHTFQPKKNS